MLQSLLYVAPRAQDVLTLRRARVLAILMLLYGGITLLMFIPAFAAGDLWGSCGVGIGLALVGATYAINRGGRLKIAVTTFLIGQTLLPITMAISSGTPVPPVFFLISVVASAAMFCSPRVTLLWAAGLTGVPFLLNLLLYGVVGGPESPTVIPGQAVATSILGLEYIAIGLLWAVAGAMALSCHMLNQAIADSRAATARAEAALVTAEQANQLKSQFMTTMTHELRTPLNAIINFTHMLGTDRYGALTEHQRVLQRRALANADRLLVLVNNILDLASIEAERLELAYEVSDLHELIGAALAGVRAQAEDKELALIDELPERLPSVHVDRARVRQVLHNLLSNAVKFTEQGSVTVWATPQEDGRVQVAVADTGIGIAPEDRDLIFEPFRQVQGGLSRQYEGIGMGLSIARRLVELHGGQLWLDSIPGVGSTFFFTLPVAGHRPPTTDHRLPTEAYALASVADG
jgi:signal transduction histidine kinase